jgi:hypothetical protein
MVTSDADVTAGRDAEHPADPDAQPRLIRWAAALVLLFLVDAVQILLLLPGRTEELFAWAIQPEINAYVLGSAYVAGGYFFLRTCTGAPWSLIANGFPPICVFVWLAAIATFLHLGRLNDGGLPLAAWLALYVVAPLMVPAIYLANTRRAERSTGERLPQGLRLLLGGAGTAVALLALIIYLAPTAAIDASPWAFTPLTVRVVATVIALYGSVWLTIALRPDAAGARIPLESQIIGLGFLLVAVARGGGAIDWDNGLAPLFIASAAAMLATSATVRVSIHHVARDDRVDATAVQVRRTGRERLVGLVLVAALVGTAAFIATLIPTQRRQRGEPFSTKLTPIPTNRVAADGRATLRLSSNSATVTVSTTRLLDGVHLMHIHAGAQGRCPPAAAARPHGGHNTISTMDGGAFYGKAVTSLTTRGDTSLKSFLKFARYPRTGDIRYSRTLTLPLRVADLIRKDNAVILIHGIDYNDNGVYDAGLDRSDLDRSLPGEATAPAICGALSAAARRQTAEKQFYTASLAASTVRRRLLCPLERA